MFKRIERKRKRWEEEEELGLDEDTKEIMGLNDTDSDESDSSSESEQERAQSDWDSEPGFDGNRDQEEDVISGEEGVDEDPPISVEEALQDPIYVISLDPTIHGCVLCKGKFIKNAGVTTIHKNSKVHKRRFERFKLLSADADPDSNAWELVRAIQAASNVQNAESQEPSKRGLKRQAKQAGVREKRKRHKELKAKAIAKKALKKQSANGGTGPDASSEANLRDSPESQRQPAARKPRKKQKLESKTTTSKTLNVTAKSPSRTKSSSDSKKYSQVRDQRRKGSQRAIIT